MDRPTTLNANPSVYPITLWGLVGMVMHTACATQQNSLIGTIPKIEFFHWSRQCHHYLAPYAISPNQIFTTHDPHTYIYVTHLTLLWENLQAYHIEGTVQQEKEQKFQGASRALGIV